MKVTDFIICDDVRIEQLNKVSLMGLYNDKIAITVEDKSAVKWPFVMSLGIYIRLDSAPKEMPPSFNFDVHFLLNGNKLGGLEGNVTPFAGHLAAIPAKIPQFPLTEEGELVFRFTAKDEEQNELYTFDKSINITVYEQSKK